MVQLVAIVFALGFALVIPVGASPQPENTTAVSGEAATSPTTPMLRAQAAAVSIESAAAVSIESAAAVSIESAAGGCTPADGAMMMTSFAAEVADCGKQAYAWFRFSKSNMAKCIRNKIGLSSPCAACFATAGQFGFDNCKVACLFGDWCSDRCLSCTGADDHDTQQCVGAGVAVPAPQGC